MFPTSAVPSEPDLPVAAGDLRETFDDLLLLGEEPPGPRVRPPSTADAAALFRADQAPRRKVTLAEARSRPRRCPSCTSVVPAGMSLCSRCGLDLDTGQRTVMEEILDDEAPPPPREAGPPLGISIIGGLAFLSSLMLAVFCVIRSQQATEGRNGFLLLALVSAFGVFAAVQFLRGRSVKLLMTALMLGGVMDLIILVALPIYDAINRDIPHEDQIDLVTGEMPRIPSFAEVLEVQKIEWGIAILLVLAGAMIYLMTAGVRKHYERTRLGPTVPVP